MLNLQPRIMSNSWVLAFFIVLIISMEYWYSITTLVRGEPARDLKLGVNEDQTIQSVLFFRLRLRITAIIVRRELGGQGGRELNSLFCSSLCIMIRCFLGYQTITRAFLFIVNISEYLIELSILVMLSQLVVIDTSIYRPSPR